MNEISTRHAVPADVDALLAFWAVAGENGSRPADGPEPVRRLIERDPEAVLLAEAGGRIVATIIAGWDGWRANLYRLAVDPDLRGRGLGKRMLALAEERLRALGAGRFCAMVLEDNELGRGLWRTAGYHAQEDWRRWVKPA